MHQMMLLNSSAVPSPARWHLRVLVLLLGITILHVWAGTALSNSSGGTGQPASVTTIMQQAAASPAALMPAEVLYQTPSPFIGPDFSQHALLEDVCAAACPDGHLVATALCSMVLVVAGLIGLYCLRTMVFLPGRNRTQELCPSVPPLLHSNGVCLLQLSISRI
ncbi:hypothetical protein ACX80U_18500 [Arthrobacter sp. TmT3-37]|uniref:hypothetical protein n=1 Tax=Arthrobacter sp. B1805 TaxID=2058892 RepID=UPI000CE2BE11|nr:hypothetical protein [Arthrobacter sp. B1805]